MVQSPQVPCHCTVYSRSEFKRFEATRYSKCIMFLFGETGYHASGAQDGIEAIVSGRSLELATLDVLCTTLYVVSPLTWLLPERLKPGVVRENPRQYVPCAC